MSPSLHSDFITRQTLVGSLGAGRGTRRFLHSRAAAGARKAGRAPGKGQSLCQPWRVQPMPGGGRCKTARLCPQGTPDVNVSGAELQPLSAPLCAPTPPHAWHRGTKCTWGRETDRVWLGAEARAAGLTWSCQRKGWGHGSHLTLLPLLRGRGGDCIVPEPPIRGLPLPLHPPETARCSRPLQRGGRRLRDAGPLLQRPPGAGRRGGGRACAGEGPPLL